MVVAHSQHHPHMEAMAQPMEPLHRKHHQETRLLMVFPVKRLHRLSHSLHMRMMLAVSYYHKMIHTQRLHRRSSHKMSLAS